jgi:hypothetical protein
MTDAAPTELDHYRCAVSIRMALLWSLIIIGAPFLYAWRCYGAFARSAAALDPHTHS